MHVHYRWDDEAKTLMVVRLDDDWTWVEYFTVLKEITSIIRQLGYIVDVIVYNTAKMPFPSGSALVQLRRIVNLLPGNIGLIVVVGSNPLIKTMNQILFRLMPSAGEITALADTQEEAYVIVAERRAARGHVG